MEPLDLGNGHTLRFVGWGPDRELNPQYAHLPAVGKFGAIVTHLKPDGSECAGYITFEGTVARYLGRSPVWTVREWEPLTLSPSILCKECGDHGFIHEGKWESV